MTSTSRSALAQALRIIADIVETEAVELAGTDWIDQSTSPLGRVRHCAAVRRRVQRGESGATIIGRLFRLSPEALAEELSKVSKKRVKSAPMSTVADDLARRVALVGLGGGRR